MAHHAKVGGEIGANGEAYKGGQFVNTIPENEKRSAAERKRAAAYMARRQEIAPGLWACPPSPTARAIFGQLAGVCRLDRAANTFGPVPEQYRAYVGAEGAAVLDAHRAAYARGERWTG